MEIAVEATPVLSYAMAHNEIPAISRLRVDGAAADVRAATVRLTVSDALGTLGGPRDVLLDLAAGEPTVLSDLTLVLDPAAMLQVEEQRPGTIRAELRVGGELVAEQEVRTRVLAAGQWLAEPPALALELLAAHVQPNHPAVGVLLAEVAERLRAGTGSPSIQGYQAGPERVDQIVAAVFAAVQARGIRYAEPPASWADTGQKVRTPGEVLDERVGTCLDLVLTMAAALELAGIRPLLWLVPGHAFLGWWREESSLGSVVEFDATGVVNRVDLGQQGLLETTAVTTAVDFAAACRLPAAAHLGGDLAVLGVVDVQQARADRIVPLPARTRGPDGTVQVSVYQPAPAAAVAGPPAAPVPGDGARPRPEPPRVSRWKNALLDLSLRNRLINLTSRSVLSLAVPPGGPARLEDLLHQGTSITLRAADELAATDVERGVRHGRDLPPEQLADLLDTRHAVHVDVPAAGYATRLRALAYRARTTVEETGANNLYLSLGTLVWQLDGRPLRSPLVLVPVQLRAAARGGRYRLALDETGSSTPNYCLLEKLRQLHGLTVPGLVDPPTDGAGIDLEAAFAAVRRSIDERGLPYRVEPTADLGVLQFAKFRLWKDLDENWPALAANPLVAHLIGTPTDAFADPAPEVPLPDLEELGEGCPVPADASQLRAVAEAVAGRTFVLEGPPGTGKSQTITNLLARAIAAGQRVLFVAEKRAALDVVQRRLEAVGIGPLALDLHDKGSKPTAVREQIARAFEHAVPADAGEHDLRLEELRSARRVLTRYAYKLHDGNAAGLSLYRAHGAVLGAPEDVPAMPLPESLLEGPAEDVQRLRQVLSTLPEAADAARPAPDHPWGFVDRVTVDVAAVRAAALRLNAALPALPPELGPALDAARTPADLAVLADLVAAGHPLAVLDETRQPRWEAAVRAAVAGVDTFVATPHPGLEAVTPAVLGLPVEDIDAAARAAAGSGWFGRRKRLKAVRERLAPVLRPEATVRPKAVPALTADLVRLRAAVRALAGSLTAIPGLSLPPDWDPYGGRAELARRIDEVRRAGARVEPAARLAGPLRAALAAGVGVDPGPVRAAADAAGELAATGTAGPDPAGPADGARAAGLAEWAGDAGLLRRWAATAPRRALADPELGSLRRWLDLLRHLEPLRSAHLDEARAALLTGRLDPDDARLAYEAGLAATSVGERLRRTGLDRFDRVAHERSIGRFGTAAAAVRGHLATAIPRQVLAVRGFDPAASGGRVGELQRQLTRRRGGLRVRELMSEYGDVITRALPCVLVSPESLARFFPAEAGLFDIVVFDEASQVRVADAIGAMGRARSVVVVGDSKQLPPTSVAESGFADDLDAEPLLDVVEDEESILTECVQARVPRHRLTWHYRSQDETLIAFSNHHYYDGGLATFPAPARAGTGVSLVRVDGHFHRSGPRDTFRTNPVEAEAVVAEIRRRFDASPDRAPSVGVVTFNLQQRAYIEGLLRDAGDQRLLDALEDPDGLFVKNLENVQGDERDVVLFSTAFSVDARGVLPLNFGPLNRAGGERRLNVAVTRARRQVIVFASFDPEQLRTAETSSVGVRHLRSYLELAAHGPAVLPRGGRRGSEPDRHRDEVAARLRERGVPVRTDVGLSDFALDLVLGEPADPRVAVLLDGPAWARRLTARDRDALPREVLTGALGWPAVERVWLPDWLADPDAVLDRLVAALSRPAAPVLPEAAPAPAAQAVQPVEPAPVGHPDEELFRPWPVRVLGTVDVLTALPAPAAARTVAAALAEVVAAEGPVPLDRLARLVATGFGLTRITEPRKAAILRHLPPSVRVDDAEPVAWPAGLAPAGWTGFRRTPEGADRPLEQVPLREVVNAMAAVTRASAGVHEDELPRLVLAVFGGRRLTPAAADRLTAALALGLRSGRLATEGGTVRAGPAGVDIVRGMRGTGGGERT